MQCNFYKCHQRYLLSRAKKSVLDVTRTSATVTTTTSSGIWRRVVRCFGGTCWLPPSLKCDTIWCRLLLPTFSYYLPSYKASHPTSLRTSPMQSVTTEIGLRLDTSHFSSFIKPSSGQIHFPSCGTVLLLLCWGTSCLTPFTTVNSERPSSAIITLSQHTKWELAGQESSYTAHCKAGTAFPAMTRLWAGRPGVRNPGCAKYPPTEWEPEFLTLG